MVRITQGFLLARSLFANYSPQSVAIRHKGVLFKRPTFHAQPRERVHPGYYLNVIAAAFLRHDHRRSPPPPLPPPMRHLLDRWRTDRAEQREARKSVHIACPRVSLARL